MVQIPADVVSRDIKCGIVLTSSQWIGLVKDIPNSCQILVNRSMRSE